MTPLSTEEASRIALQSFEASHAGRFAPGALGAGPPVRVARLDRPGSYILVPLRDARGLRGIVQLDEDRGVVEASAAVADPSSGFLLPADMALTAAKRALPARRGWGAAFLGWRPCRESQDSMQPLWVLKHDTGTAFVTQAVRVVEALTSGRGG